MLAAQAIALHHAAMDCFGRAMETEPDDQVAITRLQRNAASLTRAFTATLRTLQRCQADSAREESMQGGNTSRHTRRARQKSHANGRTPARRRRSPEQGWARTPITRTSRDMSTAARVPSARSRTTARGITIPADPPTAENARNTESISRVGDNAQPMQPSVNTAVPATNGPEPVRECALGDLPHCQPGKPRRERKLGRSWGGSEARLHGRERRKVHVRRRGADDDKEAEQCRQP
jgi:hypothetical protein